MSDHAADLEQMASTIEDYFQGMYHSDAERLRKAFHPQAQVMGHFSDSLVVNTLEQFLKFVAKTPAPSAGGEAYDMRIVSMDRTGQAGVVKVADLYLGLRFTDYLSMLKIDGRWVIVHKTYFHEPIR
ncbi:MAG: nuclear transport factor 2 family protein [Proteobacteria bacterium]|nr:nuclear transport factor 2 family protein [Pseudomonadota bacterium]